MCKMGCLHCLCEFPKSRRVRLPKIGSKLVSLFHAEFLSVEAKFNLVELGQVYNISEDIDTYVKRFYKSKFLWCLCS